MQPEALKYLNDILVSAARIANYTAGKTREDYLSTEELRDAVQWNFAVIGEALSQLNKLHPGIADKISEWRRIIAFRNQLIHGYGVIDSEITWDIIEKKLPALISEARTLISAG